MNEGEFDFEIECERWGSVETNEFYDVYDRDIFFREEQQGSGVTIRKARVVRGDVGLLHNMAR